MMDLTIIILVSTVISAILTYLLGWRFLRKKNKSDHSNSYAFGYLVGILYVFSGVLFIILLLLDIIFGVIGHGFSTGYPISVLIGLGALTQGLGINGRNKTAIVIAPITSLFIPLLFIQGLDLGLYNISIIEMIVLIIMLMINGYYFYYNWFR